MSKRLEHLQNLKDGYAALGRPVPGHVQDQLLAEITRLVEPAVVVDYPHLVHPGPSGKRVVSEPDFCSVFKHFDLEPNAWERGTTCKLDPSKRYRLELRFFEVDE